MQVFDSTKNSEFNPSFMVNKLAIYCRPTSRYDNPLTFEEIEALALGLKAVNPFFVTRGNSGYLVADTFKEVEEATLSKVLDGDFMEGSVDERGLRPTRIVVDHPLLSGLALLYYEKANA